MTFSTNALVPANYTNFNSTILLLKFLTASGSVDNTIKFTWNITNFGSKYMTIRLDFEDSSQVSKYVRNTTILHLSLDLEQVAINIS